MKFRKVFYIGRFQPPHLGHVETVKYALKFCDRVVIGIRDTKLSLENPLTTHERVECWRRIVVDEGIEHRVEIKVVPDFEKVELPIEDKVIFDLNHPLIRWGLQVVEVLGVDPRYDAFIGNKPPMVLTFNLLGFIVIPTFRSVYAIKGIKIVSASKIRNSILSGSNEWKNYVHKSIVEYLENIVKLRDRLTQLS